MERWSGAGEGNRTFVMITQAHFEGNALFSAWGSAEIPLPGTIFWVDSERVTTAYHSVRLANLSALPGRTAMQEVLPWSSSQVGNIIP
jgi:hypothetical protein